MLHAFSMLRQHRDYLYTSMCIDIRETLFASDAQELCKIRVITNVMIYYWLKIKHISKIQYKFSFLLTTSKLFLWYATNAYIDPILCFIHYSCTSLIRSSIAEFVRKGNVFT